MNANETKQLLLAFPSSSSPILIGDFNHGPAATGLIAEFAGSYQAVTEAGFISPYVREIGKCTWCSENVLTNGTTRPSIVDHIYVQDGTAVSDVKVRIKQRQFINLPIRMPMLYSGSLITMKLSAFPKDWFLSLTTMEFNCLTKRVLLRSFLELFWFQW